jgi:hypothetical protein
VRLDGPDGTPYVFDAAEIANKTARVTIDYAGLRPPERYLVATNLDPARPGVTVSRAFGEILRLPFETRAGALYSVRDVHAPTAGDGSWIVEYWWESAGTIGMRRYGNVAGSYDFGSIELDAGDALNVVYVGPGSGSERDP